MCTLKIGDIVARKSYGFDILFKVEEINNCNDEKTATLKGIAYRIVADAPESDLVVQSEKDIYDYNLKIYKAINKKLRNIKTYV